MKYLKITLLLLLFSQSPMANSQYDDTLGLKRFFWGIIPSTILKSDGKKEVTDLGEGYTLSSGGTGFSIVGLQFEIGNYWVLSQKKRTTGFFRLTWTKIGIHNYGLLLAPAQVGFGAHFDFSRRSSLDVVLNAGLVIATDDALDPEFEFTYAIYPQIKYNFNRFSVGFEYTYRKYYNHPVSFRYGYHYLGLVLGGTVGRRINK